MVLGQKIRIYPNAETRGRLNAIFRLTDYIYNKCITSLTIDGKIPDSDLFLNSIQISNLTGKVNLSFNLIPVSWQKLMLDRAIKNYKRAAKLGKKCGLRKGNENIKSFKISDISNIKFIDNKYIDIPYIGKVKTRYLRELNGKIINATIKKEADTIYYLVVNKEVENNEFKINESPKKSPIGIDLGIENLVTTSQGEKYMNEKFFTDKQKILASISRKLSYKIKGSNNYFKLLAILRKKNWKIRNQTDDFLNKLSKNIIRNHSFIGMETFSTKELMQKRRVKDMAYMDASISKFILKMKYKAYLYNRPLVFIDKYYPSSQICSNCGTRESKLKDVRIKSWKCPNCGKEHDRDINAALNILNESKMSFLISKEWLKHFPTE